MATENTPNEANRAASGSSVCSHEYLRLTQDEVKLIRWTRLLKLASEFPNDLIFVRRQGSGVWLFNELQGLGVPCQLVEYVYPLAESWESKQPRIIHV